MIYPQTFEEKIGMTEVRAMLKQHCLSTMGQERVDAIAFSTDAAELRERLQQVGEFARMQEETDGFPEQGYYDLRPTLARIRIEGTYLEVEELAQLKRSLETILAIRAMLTPHAATDEADMPYPALSRMVAARTASSDGRSQGVALLIRRIDGVLDKFGHVKDSASPELARIRRELAATEGSIGRVLNGILRAAQAEGTVAADVAPTVRDGRLVIPVAPALKRKLKGIVHDESATGKTVFIEPQEVVEANNRIRELEAEERREVIRILRELTETVRPLCPELLESYEMMADMELVRAKALLAHEMGAPTTTEPQIAAHPLIDWTLAVHPLLQRSLAKHGKRVVPLDIELMRRQRILLISGPNAGGKSVCLKTVGLLQYMLQCGLPITVGERSRVGIFEHIMIDIGDEQSLEDELSTYSSHLLNMKQMMRRSDPATLLLIDEFGGGTEPQIGGAMAEAVLRRFVRQGAFGIITTHYQNLKHFAEETEGVANGAMLYDRHLMQPLFQLQTGQPGSSFAVEIARKIGIPEEVIADASDIVGRDYINADKWLQDIVRDRRYWQQKRDTIHGQERQMQQTIEHYESEMGELRQQRKEILRKAREEAEQLLQEANARIERTIREIRETQAEKEETRRARQQLEDFKIKEIEAEDTAEDDAIARKMEKLRRRQEKKKNRPTPDSSREGGAASGSSSASKAQPLPSLMEGGRSFVRLKGQSSVGQLLSIDGKQATVLFGQMRTTVALDRLVAAQAPKREETQAGGITFLGRETQREMREKSLNFRQDIDVRGMRAEEALNAVTHFIDDAVQVGVARVRILHGTGTGALRQVIRQYLRTVPDVVDARDEHVQFGGAGITIVDLA
ncbi:MAG: Smr/MutS family protein [Bacteroidaceae bacterium]|nr:Smr/MutS family protein [Bacteroidaceae bacterium]